jgi:hypothetical protein
MTLAELIRQFRVLADDLPDAVANGIPRWSDQDVVAWFNEAEQQAAYRRRELEEVSFPSYGTISASLNSLSNFPIIANQGLYQLDPRVLFIRRVQISGSTIPLAATDFRDMERWNYNWETEKASAGEPPDRYITQLHEYPWTHQTIRIWKCPYQNGTAYLSIVRLPMQEMSLPTHTPEIHSFYHHLLVNWVLHKAYSNMDTDTYNPELSKMYLADFERDFGTREAAEESEIALQKQRSARNYKYANGIW